MGHVVLLGDSSLDNGAYTGGGPDVAAHLRQALPPGWRVTLLALDGSSASDVPAQLARLPRDATHLVISVGGNDALANAEVLDQRARSVGDALGKLADIRERFQRDYGHMLRTALAHRLPTVVCTIYYPRFPDTEFQRVAVTALSIFNDCIISEAAGAGLPLIDLRRVCAEDADFANPIEPSATGGARIAQAIARVVLRHDFSPGRTAVYT